MRRVLMLLALSLCVSHSAMAHEEMLAESEYILLVDVDGFAIEERRAYASYELPGLDTDTIVVALGKGDGESVAWGPLPWVFTTTQTLVVVTWYFQDGTFVLAVHANRNVDRRLLETVLEGRLIKVSVIPPRLAPMDQADALPAATDADELFTATMERRLEADEFIAGESTFALAVPWSQLTASALRYGLMQAYIEVQYPGRRSRGWIPLPLVILAGDVGAMEISVEFLEGQIDLSVSASPVMTAGMLSLFEGAVFRAVLIAPKWTET